MKMKERICYLLLCLPCFLIRAHDFVLTNIRTGEETTFSDALDEKKAGGAIDQGEMRRTERFNKVLRTERNKIKSNNRFGSSSLSNANQAKAADNDDDNEDRYIIKFTDDVSFQRHARRLKSNGAMSTPIMTLEEEHIQVMSLSSPEEIAEWEIQDGVKYVEKDHKVFLRQNTPGIETIPYGISQVKALDVSDDRISNRKVCIIDSGYDITHPDLQNDFVSGSGVNPWDEDECGHGTHVAGTIAAVAGNGGILGAVRSGNMNLHIVRTFTGIECSWTWGSSLIAAMYECIVAGSNIINLSLGYKEDTEYEKEAFDNIFNNRNVLLIAAAGNDGTDEYEYPAAYSSVLSVAAVSRSKSRASFSQMNDMVDIAAPGVDILSTYSGGAYSYQSGTSMSVPHVVGVAALIWSHFPQLSASEIWSALEVSAEDLGSVGRDDLYGHGLVDALEAYNYLLAQEDQQPTISPSTSMMPTSCGNNYCDILGSETCSSCPKDCLFPRDCNFIGERGELFFTPDIFGVSFKLRALTDVRFYEIDVGVGLQVGSHRAILYTRDGSYTTNLGLQQWRVVFNGKLQSDGNKVTVPIDDPIFTEGGSERSFYFSFYTGFSIAFNAWQQQYLISSENSDIILYYGELQGNSFGTGIMNYAPFGGILRYTKVAPETQAPTISSSPSISCVEVELKISTDNWPNETSWDFRDSDGEIIPGADSSNYILSSNALFETNICLPELCDKKVTPYYTFNIYDSYNDGIIGNGYFELFVNGDRVKGESDGSTFGARDAVVIDACSSNEVLGSVFPTRPPSSKPSSKPSIPKTSEPTMAFSNEPSMSPIMAQSGSPSLDPSSVLSPHPSEEPSSKPSIPKTSEPTMVLSNEPSMSPIIAQSSLPSLDPSSFLSPHPSEEPSSKPSIPNISLSPSAHPNDVNSNPPSFKPLPTSSTLPSSWTDEPSRPLYGSYIPTDNPSKATSLRTEASHEPSGQPEEVLLQNESLSTSAAPSLFASSSQETSNANASNINKRLIASFLLVLWGYLL